MNGGLAGIGYLPADGTFPTNMTPPALPIGGKGGFGMPPQPPGQGSPIQPYNFPLPQTFAPSEIGQARAEGIPFVQQRMMDLVMGPLMQANYGLPYIPPTMPGGRAPGSPLVTGNQPSERGGGGTGSGGGGGGGGTQSRFAFRAG